MWEIPATWTLEVADTAIDIAVLLGLVQVIHHIIRQQREIHALEGLLPICGFCKRIRGEDGSWCGRQHYGALVE